MQNHNSLHKKLEIVLKKTRQFKRLLLVFTIAWISLLYICVHPEIFNNSIKVVSQSKATAVKEEIKNGIHLESGLIAEGNYELILTNCGACHALSMVTQNKASKQGWTEIITWMQETEGLWDLGDEQDKIIDYLATYYAPENTGRRKNLENVEWYEL